MGSSRNLRVSVDRTGQLLSLPTEEFEVQLRDGRRAHREPLADQSRIVGYGEAQMAKSRQVQ